VFIKVLPILIERRKKHFFNLPVGASIILGRNGYIWISPLMDNEDEYTGGYIQNLEVNSLYLIHLRIVMYFLKVFWQRNVL